MPKILGTIYTWRFLVLLFMESVVPKFQPLHFLCFFRLKIAKFWSVNYESCFGHFRFMDDINIGSKLVVSYLERSISKYSDFSSCFYGI